MKVVVWPAVENESYRSSECLKGLGEVGRGWESLKREFEREFQWREKRKKGKSKLVKIKLWKHSKIYEKEPCEAFPKKIVATLRHSLIKTNKKTIN